MATPSDQDEKLDDLLTCTICLELFRVPKYLPCLHTFCEVCIGTFISSSATKENDQNGFHCPVCRTFVSMENSTGNQKAWAEQLPKNHFVNSMMDKIAIDKSEKFCNACESGKIKQIAVSWCIDCQEAFCQTCENCHRRFKISASHNIVSIDDLKSGRGVLFTGSVSCDDHLEKSIEIYCVDHAHPCCTVCATVKHRKCDNVVSIEQAISGIKESEETVKLSKNLNAMISLLKKSTDNADSNISCVESEANAVIQEIENMRDSLISHVTQTAELAKGDLEQKKNSVLSRLNSRNKEISGLKSTVENWQKLLSTCLVHGSEIRCFLEVKRLISKLEETETKVKPLTADQKQEIIIFNRNQQIDEFKNSVTSFGDISITSKSNMQDGKVRVLFSVDVGQNNGYSVSGLFLGQLIVLSNLCSRKILFFNSDGTPKETIDLTIPPYDVCKIRDGLLAISHFGKDISIFNISTMKIESTLKDPLTSVGGLHYIKDKFFTSFSKTLRLIDAKSGEIIWKTETKGHSYYSYSKENDYIHADGENTVSRTADEVKKFSYTSSELSSPRGIDVDLEGNIYICGFDSNNIHQLTHDGKLIRIIKSSELGIKKPWVIRFKENFNRFLLTSLASGKVVVCEIR